MSLLRPSSKEELEQHFKTHFPGADPRGAELYRTSHIFDKDGRCVSSGGSLRIVDSRARMHGGVVRIGINLIKTLPESRSFALVRVAYDDGHYALMNFASAAVAANWAKKRSQGWSKYWMRCEITLGEGVFDATGN